MKYAAAALASLLILAGCSPTTPTPDVKRQQRVRMAITNDPESLDPRKVRSLSGVSTVQLLHEGLMRYREDGSLEPALAEDVLISKDGTSYTFFLRPAFWSNGQPITAEDFIHAWKSQLQPGSTYPNAQYLHYIRGATMARSGAIPVDAVALFAPTSSTLIVELEKPCPYFLHLTTTTPYFPVNHTVDINTPEWAEKELDAFTSSGAFTLNTWDPQSRLLFERNPHYWDRDPKTLDEVELLVLDDNTALELFETGHLEWAGSPLSSIPPEALRSLKAAGRLRVQPAFATHWLRFNVESEPFNHPKIRKAFGLAIDRTAMVDHVFQAYHQPATSIIPSTQGWQPQRLVPDQPNAQLANQLLDEALEELGVNRLQLPALSLSYGEGERHHQLAQALQQQWYETLGIWVELEGMGNKLLFDRYANQDYHIANGSWFADFLDPVAFLEIFENRDTGTNNTGWESPNFQQLLEASFSAKDLSSRQENLLKAEQLLLEEHPVTPIFHYSMHYLTTPQLENAFITPLGYPVLRKARLARQ